MEDPLEQQLSLVLQTNLIEGAGSFDILLSSLIIIVLLFCSALISGSEVAYFSLSPSDTDLLKNGEHKNYKEILSLLSKPKKLLATILIGNNFVNVAIVILSTFIVNEFIHGLSDTYKFIIQLVLVTFMLLLIGEVLPKVYATKNSLKLASFTALPLYYMRAILSPLSRILVSSTNFIDKRIKKRGHDISIDELSHALELTSKNDTSDEDHKILEGIVNFGNTEVKQIMTSRVDVASIQNNSSFKEVIDIILESGYSRIPVYEDNFDHVLGVLYIKDLLPHLHEEEFDWMNLIRDAFFIPENKKIDDLLREFQLKKIHLAIVVDEYGGSSGIVTLEDILEEIVGEISDEFDDEDLIYSKLDDHNYVFEGKIPLNDMYKVLGIDGTEFEKEKGEAETLAGFIIEVSGKIPKKNEKIRMGNYLITVEAADKRRVKRIKLTLTD